MHNVALNILKSLRQNAREIYMLKHIYYLTYISKVSTIISVIEVSPIAALIFNLLCNSSGM